MTATVRCRSSSRIIRWRLGAERNWEPFLRAFHTAADARPELRLRVIGHGPGLRAARDSHRHPAVEFLGTIPRHAVLHELAAADIFCNPALVETFGVAELEAMRLGRCVISGSGFGKHTLVNHQATGVTIPVRTGPEGFRLNEAEWSRWLVRTASDATLRQCLGRRARAAVRDRYPVERSAVGALAILEQACGEWRCRVTVS